MIIPAPESFEELISLSKNGPVVIFKHSTTCPVSATAYQEMARFDGEVALVEVQKARRLSTEIENRTGVIHESPQVLILHNGKVVWNASHWKVKSAAVEEALHQAEEG